MNPLVPDTTLRPSTTEARSRNEAAVPRLWLPDLGNGRYRNPIIHADYSDPDVIRQGNDFYMTASSFNCTPGLPILYSQDLVNWRLINHAVKNLPNLRYEQVQPGCGIWAPAIRFHDGRFWIFFAMPDEGIYITTADDPAGKWSDPRLNRPLSCVGR
jgi:beta-xylosidase